MTKRAIDYGLVGPATVDVDRKFAVDYGFDVDRASYSDRIACSLESVRGVAQPGRALGSGPRGRKFKSCRPD